MKFDGVAPEAARFYEELGSTRVTGELHNTIGDIYMQYLDIPEKVVANAEFARLETAYRNYEANNTVANAAAFLDEAGKVQRIASSKGYNVESPYTWVNAAIEAESVSDAELAQAYVNEENLLTQELMDEIDSERSIGDNSLDNIADGYLHGGGPRKAIINMSPKELSKLTPEQFKELLPDGWTYQESPDRRFIHIKDLNNNYRIRIDPPDKVTNYTHIHIYDEDGNAIDINGNIVPSNSTKAHIPYYK